MIKIIHKHPIPTHGIERNFSLEEHGNDYKKVAAEYAETNKNIVVEVIDTEAKESSVVNEISVADIKAKLTEKGISFKGNASRVSLLELLNENEVSAE